VAHAVSRIADMKSVTARVANVPRVMRMNIEPRSICGIRAMRVRRCSLRRFFGYCNAALASFELWAGTPDPPLERDG
ncbi:MAG TPA: hypothetical protein VN289_12095, partial [Paraburkholderia sp.]|nr:hypothetical protein [Paraburkholderia sp.]